MIKRAILFSLALAGSLFGGGLPFAMEISRPLQMTQTIVQPVSKVIEIPYSIGMQDIVVFKGSGLPQDFTPHLSDLSRFGIDNAASSFMNGNGAVAVQVSSPELYTSFEQQMIQQNMLPDKVITSTGDIFTRCDGTWMSPALLEKGDISFSQNEMSVLQHFSGQQAELPLTSAQVPQQAGTQELNTTQQEGASSSLNYHRNPNETVGFDLGQSAHVGATATYSEKHVPLTPEQQRYLQEKYAHQDRLARMGTPNYTEADRAKESDYYLDNCARDVSKLKNADEVRQAQSNFDNHLAQEGIQQSQKTEAIQQALDARLNHFEGKAQQEWSDKLTRNVYKKVEHTLKGNSSKQRHYENNIELQKADALSSYRQEHYNDSLSKLQGAHADSQNRVAELKRWESLQEEAVKRAGPRDIETRANLERTRVEIGLEKAKQHELEKLIQHKTFTAQYKNDLTALQQKIESTPQELRGAYDDARLSALNETLATNGAVQAYKDSISPEVNHFSQEVVGYNNQFDKDFVGNAYEHQLYKENLDNMAAARDLHITAYSDEPARDCAEATAHFSNAAVSVVHENPTAAQYLTDFSTAMVKIGKGCAEIAEGCAKGVALGTMDSLVGQANMLLHPIDSAKSLGEGIGLLSTAINDVLGGNPKALATFDKAVSEFTNLPLAKQAEHLSRFVTSVMAPSPSKLLKIPGVQAGLKTLDKIGQRELKALNALAKTDKLELATVNGIQTTKAIANEVATIEKGAGRALLTEETFATVKNLEGQLAHKAPVTSAVARGADNVSVSFKEGLNFSKKTALHMDNPDRFVPVQVLKDAIKSGKSLPDPRGTGATMYYSTMYKNGKTYNLEVLYNKGNNTIYHFKYTSDSIGPLSVVKR